MSLYITYSAFIHFKRQSGVMPDCLTKGRSILVSKDYNATILLPKNKLDTKKMSILKFRKDVGKSGEHPELCARCVDVVLKLGRGR